MPIYSQIGAREKYLITVINTAWMYPTANIEAALATTAVPHTYTGDQIVATTTVALSQIAEDIWQNTAVALPPQGFNLRTGLLLEDLGRVLTFQTSDGSVFLLWRLMRLSTDQSTMPDPGAAPVGTVGYVPTFVAPGNVVGAQFDPVRVVRTG